VAKAASSLSPPFGRGQKFSSDNKVVNALIGGWNLNGVVSLSSGIPFDVGTGKDIANTGNYNYGNGYGYERLNLVGSPYPPNKSPSQWIDQASFSLRRHSPSATWGGTRCAPIRTKTSTCLFFDSFLLPSDGDWNFALKCSTPSILRFGRYQ